MDAVEFIKARNRMCKSYSGCFGCPLVNEECYQFCDVNVEVIAPIVEQWAKEHPIKTRQSVFLEQWPEAQIDDNGVPCINPCQLLEEYRSDDGCTASCTNCRREFWMQEVE